MPSKKVAIVGSGCSGMAALWALKNTDHEVHLYEAEDRLGGHTNTVPWKNNDKTIGVDTGFIVMNTATYPNFIAFLANIGVKPVPTDMTFGVCRDWGTFEWSGTSLASIFAQKRNLVSLRMWRMIFDIIRFNQYALDLLATEDESESDPTGSNGAVTDTTHPRDQTSIGQYLDQHGYSKGFREDYLIPMTACVWSTSPDKVTLDFPAITLVRFLWNHHLLNTISARPQWLTIPGGSMRYIDRVIDGVAPERIHLGMPVQSVKNVQGGVQLHFDNGTREKFDHVILATHGDTTASIISAGATDEENEIMSAFRTSRNTAVLHSDRTLLPSRKMAWSAWNYLTTSPSPGVQPNVCLTYNMNILQHLPADVYGDVLVTLNPLRSPRKSTIQGEWTYHHPLYNAAAVRAQKMLPSIQDTRGISYAGAWTKYGFHEDGFSSGLKVAIEHLGARIPFEFVDSTFSRGRRPQLGLKDYAVRWGIRAIQLWVLLVGVALQVVGLKRAALSTEARSKKMS